MKNINAKKNTFQNNITNKITREINSVTALCIRNGKEVNSVKIRILIYSAQMVYRLNNTQLVKIFVQRIKRLLQSTLVDNKIEVTI